ncbi:MAG: isoprenyl synthetase [Marinilabiliales bacterium]|nr:MAG: isoprenyl synthetase [Marinilabiliales bacterium]
MNNSKTLQDRFNNDLGKLDFGKSPERLYDPIYYALSVGGKRIRPVLCLMASELFGGNYEKTINAAFGIEIFHNFTLLHDDMMDKAEMRRGKPVVHVKWTENIALLSGDAMSVIAYKYISESPNNLKDLLDVFSDTALKICEGKQYDMDFETMSAVSEDEYLKMINLKTAVLLAASLKIGAICANADKANSEKLYRFGENLGMAFQLQDDLLDVYGNPAVFGKNIGGDIIANKKTYLLIKALELANQEQHKNLNYWLNLNKFVPEEKINAVKSIYNEIGIREYSENLMNQYFKKAFDFFDSISIEPEKKEILKNYTLSMKKRDY